MNAFCTDWNDGYQGENCQNLNIWTPSISDKTKRPVMVWIHGGGFSTGSSHEMDCYDGLNLSSKGDVVVVSINHRLNVLGFLDLSFLGEKYRYSGNNGMLDIIAALKWIKANIASFGGDPDNVTLFGQSGGGGKISTLMGMPSAQGLYNKVIIQSGAHLDCMRPQYSRMIGQETLKILGISEKEQRKLLDIPYETLLKTGNEAIAKVKALAHEEGNDNVFIFGWDPVADGVLIPKDPFVGTASEFSKSIPMLIGTTMHEFPMSTLFPEGKAVTMDQVSQMLSKSFGENTDKVIEAFSKAYPDFIPADLIDCEFDFRNNAVKEATLQSEMNGAPVYNYIFAWESPILDGRNRSSHCLDIPFVFNNIDKAREMTGGSKEAYQMARIMSDIWISFAKEGRPSCALIPEWEPFTAEGGEVMILNNESKMAYKPDFEWLSLLECSHYSKFNLIPR